VARLIELHLEDLGRSFGRRKVFQGVWATVRSGEVLVVTGPNGAGKSTLLGVIAGLQPPDRGTVRLVVEGSEPTEAGRRRLIGLVAPDLVLYPELTALENLEFFAEVRGVPWRRSAGEVDLERVGLEGRGPDLVGSFSSGMRVRLKYAVALQCAPPLLLLDEPTAMLDVGGAAIVETLIAAQREKGVLVLATNDPRETRHGDLFLELGPSA